MKARQLHLAVLGSADFCRRAHAALIAQKDTLKVSTGPTQEAWTMVLSERPDILVIEVGVGHSERHHAWLRKFLAQVRERLTNSVYIVVALTASEKFAFGGDLLFQNETDMDPSDFVDTFVASPPASSTSSPSITTQIAELVPLVRTELQRRSEGKIALPPLNAPGWVQSLADPGSRELWMKWLPRYASYTNENPLILGPTGTGKTSLSYALHLLSARKGQFVAITPRDFSSSELVQAELFGAVAGAYTGAVDKWGLVKRAEKGTLFIDELQSIDKDLQGKLITFIENKGYRRVGSAESTEADVRFVFASNQPLNDMMESHVLRDDFAYRLERVQLELLPLNERPLDVTAALGYALAKVRRQRPQALPIYGVSSGSYRLLFGYKWPGNLRQLENTVAQLCEIADVNGTTIVEDQVTAEAFETKLAGVNLTSSEVIASAARIMARTTLRQGISSIDEGVERFAETVRVAALDCAGGDVDRAAEMINDNSGIMPLVAQMLSSKNETFRPR